MKTKRKKQNVKYAEVCSVPCEECRYREYCLDLPETPVKQAKLTVEQALLNTA